MNSLGNYFSFSIDISVLLSPFHLYFKLWRVFWNETKFIKSWKVFCYKTACENCNFCTCNMVNQKVDLLLYYLLKTYPSHNNLESDLQIFGRKTILSLNYSCWRDFFALVRGVLFELGKGVLCLLFLLVLV